MELNSGILLIEFLSSVKYLTANLDPAYLDIIKIFAGSTGWIGGLTLFMWFKEKRKHAVVAS
jgi:hypothetical protein